MIEIVVPRIASHWEEVAYALRYEIYIVQAIKQKHFGDPKRCCMELLIDWLTTDHGVSPKTWSTLLKAIGDIEELVSIKQEIIEEAAISKYCV